MKKKIKKNVIKSKYCNCNSNNALGAVYGLGFLGALIYYISTATSFGTGLLGILKSFVWPAYVVYGLLKLLGM